jgi:putative transposase
LGRNEGVIGRQRHTAEQVIGKLREAEVQTSKGIPLEEVLRQLGISDDTYYKWRKEYGGLRVDQAKRLKELEQENSRLRKAIADGMYELSELFIERGVPEYLRSDIGPEFVSEYVREWLRRVGAKTLCIEPGSLWENGYIESFNGKLRDELLNGEIFDTVTGARVATERWRKHYNMVRLHSSLE